MKMSVEPELRAGRLKRNLPNTITVLSLCSGLTAIRMMLENRLEFAVFLILVAIVLDGLDGKVARLLNVSSSFGAELDSLADFLCFGIAPGLVLYRHLFEGEPISGLGWMVVLCLITSCMLRLARFNVAGSDETNKEEKSQHFVGVPAPALAFLSLLPVYLFESGSDFFKEQPIFAVPYLLFIAGLAISTIPTISLKKVRFQVLLQKKVVVIVVLAMAVALSFPWQFLAAMSVLYLSTVAFAMVRMKV